MHKGCLFAEDDEFQFGPWLMAPKTNQRKGNFSQFRFSDNDDEDIHVPKGGEGVVGPSHIHHQPPHPPMVRESNLKTTRQQLDNPKLSKGHINSKVPDPTQNSNFEQDSFIAKSNSSQNPDSSSLSNSKSLGNPKVNSLVAPNDFAGQILNKLDPISKECISTRILLVTEKSDMSMVLNTRQQLEIEKDKGVGTVIDVKTLPDMDNKNSIGKNSNSNLNMEMEIISNYIEDLPGQNKSSLRSRKRILRSSSN